MTLPLDFFLDLLLVSFQVCFQSTSADDITQSQSPGGKQKSAKDDEEALELLYGINDVPPWYTCLLLGFQVSYYWQITPTRAQGRNQGGGQGAFP